MAETASTDAWTGSSDLDNPYSYVDSRSPDSSTLPSSYEEGFDPGDPELHHYPEPDDGFEVYGESERLHIYDDANAPPSPRRQQRENAAQSKGVHFHNYPLRDDDDLELQVHVYPDRDPEDPAPPRRARQSPKKSPRKKSRKSRTKNPRSQASTPKRYNPPLPEPKRDGESSKFWPCFSRFCTFFIPDCLIRKESQEAKLAWREKFTIFEIMIFANIVFLIIFALIPLYLCNEQTPLAEYEEYVDPACEALSWVMFALLYFVAALILLQCICSMLVGLRSLCYRATSFHPFTEEDLDASVMVMVPCYNEGDQELRKTIRSIVDTEYPDENKVLLVVADGIITGRGEWVNTPRTLANLLGFELSKRDKAYAYKSIGAHGENRASLYHGTYHCNGKSLKYIVIVKRGLPEEKDSSKPGNRGKRDSQLIALGFFNRVHHDRKLSELDEAIFRALNDLRVPITEIQYLLAIDADTRISPSSMSYMVNSLDKSPKVLACCGETKVDNKTQSWVTMIQVYEYFASHHLKKSFESVFGCVTCLPGCFTMYRMFDDDWRPLLSADNVFQSYARNDIETLHEKNLYHLGEDRMLTTLLLSYFPDKRLSFVPIAACWTIVPSEFKVLLSQRRRWINSTFHNMWELLKVNTMCGICCVSMNAIVVLDMISTMILPACVLYAASFIYVVAVEGETFTIWTLVLYGVLIGAQVAIFIVRSRFDYVFWFLIYLLLGVPVFYFILPLYSFWNMDDLSWGTTRQVTEKEPAKTSTGAKQSSGKPVGMASTNQVPRASSSGQVKTASKRLSDMDRNRQPSRRRQLVDV